MTTSENTLLAIVVAILGIGLYAFSGQNANPIPDGGTLRVSGLSAPTPCNFSSKTVLADDGVNPAAQLTWDAPAGSVVNAYAEDANGKIYGGTEGLGYLPDSSTKLQVPFKSQKMEAPTTFFLSMGTANGTTTCFLNVPTQINATVSAGAVDVVAK